MEQAGPQMEQVVEVGQSGLEMQHSMPKAVYVRGGHCSVSVDIAVPTVDVAVSTVFCKILS